MGLQSIFLYTHIFIYVCMCILIYKYICIHVNMYTHMYTYKYVSLDLILKSKEILYQKAGMLTVSFTLNLQVNSCKSCTSVQFSRSVVSDSLWPHELQHARPPCPSPTPGVYSNSCPSSRWCHPAISSSVVPFSSCPQSLPASGSFPMSQLFT